MKIQHILVTTDLTDEAARAYDPVLELAQRYGARVTLLHVVDELLVTPHGAPFAPPMSTPDLATLLRDAEEHLSKEAARAPEGVEVATVALSGGNPSKAVVEYATSNDVDLIALSTHGRSGFRRMALGSVAEEILRRSPLPILSFHRP